MSYLPELRESLVGAAGRLGDTTTERARPSGLHSRRRSLAARLRLGPGGLTAFAGVLVAVAVAAVALTEIRPRSGNQSPSAAERAVPPDLRELYEHVGLLRRPQRPSDLPVHMRRYIRALNPAAGGGGVPDLALVRRVVLPWGQRLFLIPFRATPSASGGLVVIGLGRGVTFLGGGSSSATLIDRYGSLVYGLSAPGKHELILLVPDRVATVAFRLPPSETHTKSGAPHSYPGANLVAAVHDNFAAVRIDRPPTAVEMTWYAADGSIIGHVGKLAAAAGPSLGRQSARHSARRRRG